MKKYIRNLLAALIGYSMITTSVMYADCISDYADQIPAIGLISDKIKFDGIEISNFSFADGHKYVFAKPSEDILADMDYSIHSDLLATLHLHHFILGLHDDGPQICILHSLGMGDSNGHVTVHIKAPKKKGIYQVRFCHTEALTDHQAFKAWHVGDGPSAKTIMGIVIVK